MLIPESMGVGDVTWETFSIPVTSTGGLSSSWQARKPGKGQQLLKNSKFQNFPLWKSLKSLKLTQHNTIKSTSANLATNHYYGFTEIT